MKAINASPNQSAPTGCPNLTRRRWLQSAVSTVGLATVVSVPSLTAIPQEPRLLEAVRAMSVMTGVDLADRWLEPTSSLVGIILDYSRGLRELNLGELEPATFFVAS